MLFIRPAGQKGQGSMPGQKLINKLHSTEEKHQHFIPSNDNSKVHTSGKYGSNVAHHDRNGGRGNSFGMGHQTQHHHNKQK